MALNIALHHVLVNRPDMVVAASKSDVPEVRIEVLRLMGNMNAHRAIFGPVLTAALLDSDDRVADASIQSLGSLDWCDQRTIDYFRRRFDTLRTEWMRDPWTIALRGMEQAAAKKK